MLTKIKIIVKFVLQRYTWAIRYVLQTLYFYLFFFIIIKLYWVYFGTLHFLESIYFLEVTAGTKFFTFLFISIYFRFIAHSTGIYKKTMFFITTMVYIRFLRVEWVWFTLFTENVATQPFNFKLLLKKVCAAYWKFRYTFNPFRSNFFYTVASIFDDITKRNVKPSYCTVNRVLRSKRGNSVNIHVPYLLRILPLVNYTIVRRDIAQFILLRIAAYPGNKLLKIIYNILRIFFIICDVLITGFYRSFYLIFAIVWKPLNIRLPYLKKIQKNLKSSISRSTISFSIKKKIKARYKILNIKVRFNRIKWALKFVKIKK